MSCFVRKSMAVLLLTLSLIVGYKDKIMLY